MEGNNNNGDGIISLEDGQITNLKETKKTVEEWRIELKIDDATFSNVSAMNRWEANKKITKKEFEEKIDAFLKGNGVVERKTIEEWKKELNTKEHIFSGVVAFMGWLPNKTVTETEYQEALRGFLNG